MIQVMVPGSQKRLNQYYQSRFPSVLYYKKPPNTNLGSKSWFLVRQTG